MLQKQNASDMTDEKRCKWSKYDANTIQGLIG